ncbi:hypothetical protein Riv7116_0945 [Rivularia sp. PCC 7116]|uniref:hypothetical protein n=1 Tax=Rivularia sp. PCC 7116 TaxID=373994 RepID=UPI00029F1168|nr:hypothetical protein [Rivularia sp. PCC 7116]AFY53522.1 hypothetical protein Riv7116_0945 [Rivularia sp. PCC 7116]
MLAQFQSLYPTGSLTTELLQIHHGKYIVRSSVQVEGVTRATGMAASEIIEEAEDRSRTRALMVLGITDEESQPEVQQKQVSASPQSNLEVLENRSLTTAKARVESPPHSTNSSEVTQTPISNTPPAASSQVAETPISNIPPVTSAQVTQTPVPDTRSTTPELAETSVVETVETSPPPELFLEEDNSDIYSQEFDKSLPIQTYSETEFDAPDNLDNSENPEIASDNPPEEEPTPSKTSSKSTTGRTTKKKTTSTTKRKKKSEPIDLSDVIAKTDVEMERLSWTPQQGREYLIQTYGKRGRTLLTEEELLDFLQHLESIPTPQPELSEADPLAGF